MSQKGIAVNRMRNSAVCRVVLTAAIVLIVSGKAQAVLTDFYNGAIGDADPESQGNFVGVNIDFSTVSSLTPEPDNDRVHMLAGGGGMVKYILDTDPVTPNVQVPQSIIDAVSDDVYAFEVEVQVKSPEESDADGEVRHVLNDWDFITGTNSGSLGFRDRLFFESSEFLADENETGRDRIRLVATWFPSAGFSSTIYPHTPSNPQSWTNFTSVYDRNVYRFERDGLGVGTVKLFINGDLVFQGAGSPSPIGNTQAEIRDNATEPTNLYWYRFSVDVDPSAGMPCDFSGDGECNEIDIDLLADAVRNDTSDSQFNVDGLGDPNIPDDADFDFYITDDSMLSTGFGDHDLNMIVNFNDFVVLSNNFGVTPTGWGQGNGNTDDTTNFNDFVRLSNNFGTSFVSGAVPEPAAIGALGILALVWLRKRR